MIYRNFETPNLTLCLITTTTTAALTRLVRKFTSRNYSDINHSLYREKFNMRRRKMNIPFPNLFRASGGNRMEWSVRVNCGIPSRHLRIHKGWGFDAVTRYGVEESCAKRLASKRNARLDIKLWIRIMFVYIPGDGRRRLFLHVKDLVLNFFVEDFVLKKCPAIFCSIW